MRLAPGSRHRVPPLRSICHVVCAGVSLLPMPACAPGRPTLPDYSELLAAGVEPAQEADVVIETLRRAGFEVDERAEGEGFVALGLSRASDAHRAVRVVTRRGVAFALDSGARDLAALDPDASEPAALDPRAPLGAVHIETVLSGTDVDGDERLDVVVSRRESDRTCLLVLALLDDGGLDALRVDASGLEPTACLETFEDIDARPGAEAIVRMRAARLARSRVPTADIPLERDEAGVYGLRPPPVAYLARVRERLAASVVSARARFDEDEAYALAVEAALLARAAGESPQLQLAALDAVVGTVVWSEPLAEAVRAARAHIARGWRE